MHKKKVTKVLTALRELNSAGGEYFLVVALEKRPAPVNVDKTHDTSIYASPNLRDLEVGQELGWRVPQTIRSSKQHMRSAEVMGLGFAQLRKSLLQRLVKALISLAIRNCRQNFPWTSAANDAAAATKKIRQEHPWIPEAIQWRNPDQWSQEELVQFIAALHASRDRVAMRKLQENLPDKLHPNASELAQINTAFKALEQCQGSNVGEDATAQVTGAGTLVSIELDHGGGHAVVEADGQKYLGATACQETMIEVLRQGNFKAVVKKEAICKANGEQVRLWQLCNSMQRHGGASYARFFTPKDLRPLQLVADDIMFAKTSDWRAALKRVFTLYLRPYIRGQDPVRSAESPSTSNEDSPAAESSVPAATGDGSDGSASSATSGAASSHDQEDDVGTQSPGGGGAAEQISSAPPP